MSPSFQQPLFITLGVADEKPEGGQKLPLPAEDRVKFLEQKDHEIVGVGCSVTLVTVVGSKRLAKGRDKRKI